MSLHGVSPGGRLATHLSAAIVRSTMRALASTRWVGGEHLPRERAIVCPNHLSELDPFVVAHYLYAHGVAAAFVGKASVFRVPVFGAWVRSMGFIPVERGGIGREALRAMRRALDAGRVVVVYPEGTLTRDPGLWPMRGRDGAAWLALETGAPVTPVAHWGVQEVMPAYARRLHLSPRRTLHVAAGPPVDLSGVADAPDALREATRRIQDATTALLARLRGESAPAERWEPARRVPA